MSAPASDLARALRSALRGAVYDDNRRRAEYSSDASNYRVVPQVVVEPKDGADVAAALEICRDRGVAFTSRGGGTSIAGNAVGPGVVADFTRCMSKILHLDPDTRTAIVQPGVVLSDLQSAAARYGLRFGPDPSSATRATLGGMLGNNACGAHAVCYGRTADNVIAMTAIAGSGLRFVAGQGSTQPDGVASLIDQNLAILRTQFGRFSRQGSGYLLEQLLPEQGRHVARALVGSEGTLAVTIDATLRLVPVSPVRVLVVLGYPDMAAAADVVPTILGHAPLAVEGIDARLVDVLRRHRGAAHVPDLPRGSGWLMVELGGDSESEAGLTARAVVAAAQPLDFTVLPTGAESAALWRIREDAAGLAGRTAEGRQAWPGWEDVAVPPDRLGAYLREFEALLLSHRLHGVPYGHFGDGCVHTRIDFPLDHEPTALREFVLEAAGLAVRFGGSFSGEHGDGRARSELLPMMYSSSAIALFGKVKDLFDPQHVLNPGVLVSPAQLDAELRRPAARVARSGGGFAFLDDSADFANAVHRCVGVAKCRADTSAADGFMCPSYLATRDEKDSTRGRARVLQELTNGSLVEDWSSPELEESLDLCLSCKACASDCPAGVDVARYKAEVLFRRYRRRLRPRSHYVLGWLPQWLSAIGKIPRGPRIVNALARRRAVRTRLVAASGLDPRRELPTLAEKPLSGEGWGMTAADPTVVLWVDTFTNSFAPEVAEAAVRVLERAGHRVLVLSGGACCGLTYISTGQLSIARRRLRGLLDVLAPLAERDLEIVGLEPSCVATLRSDLVDLLPEDHRAGRVAASIRTFAEAVRDTPGGVVAPDLTDQDVVVQPHCHHHSIMGFGPDSALLKQTGATVSSVAGCCGLAGNWGMERGHYEVSVAIAQRALIPAVQGHPSAIVVADGFSCRTQIHQLTGRRALHLAQLLDAGGIAGQGAVGGN